MHLCGEDEHPHFFEVPYSSHSSYNELNTFLGRMACSQVVPHVLVQRQNVYNEGCLLLSRVASENREKEEDKTRDLLKELHEHVQPLHKTHSSANAHAMRVKARNKFRDTLNRRGLKVKLEKERIEKERIEKERIEKDMVPKGVLKERISKARKRVKTSLSGFFGGT